MSKYQTGGNLTEYEAAKAVMVSLQKHIVDLEKQLAEKDKEIERMRAVVESVCVIWYRRVEILRADAGDSTLARYHILSCISDLRHEYEQSTKPDGGAET